MAWWLAFAALALPGATTAQQGEEIKVGLWSLFWQSFDLFTIVLIAGSIAGVAIIYTCFVEIRESRVLPDRSLKRIDQLLTGGRLGELREFLRKDGSFPGHVLDAAIAQRSGGEEAMREAAEIAASEESARLMRRIEPLNVIGNLAPLVGLAGTVWGMILAFTALGEAAGSARPAILSLGISKALFHTLLGLMLAIPCLLVFGLYRAVVDRMTAKAMAVTSELLERAIEIDEPSGDLKPTKADATAQKAG